MKKYIALIFSFTIYISAPALACDVKAAQKDPGFSYAVSAAASVYNQKIFTDSDGTVNLMLDPEYVYPKIKAMHSNDYNCLEMAASRFLISMIDTSLKRHKAQKINDTYYRVMQGNKHELMIDVFKLNVDEPFIRDIYTFDHKNKRYKFVKTERFSS